MSAEFELGRRNNRRNGRGPRVGTRPAPKRCSASRTGRADAIAYKSQPQEHEVGTPIPL